MMTRDRRWFVGGGFVLVLLLAGAGWSYPPPEDDESRDERRPPPTQPDHPKDAHRDEGPPVSPDGGNSGDRKGPRRGPGERRTGRQAEQRPEEMPAGDRIRPGERLRRAAEGLGPRELTPQQIDQFMALLQEYCPRRYEMLSAMRKERPLDFQRQVRRMLLPRLLDGDAEMQKLMIQDMCLGHEINETAEKYRHARDAKTRADLAAQLRRLLDQQFDIRIAKSGHLIERIERHLAEEKTHRDAQSKNKSALIEKRLKELTGQDTSTKWPD